MSVSLSVLNKLENLKKTNSGIDALNQLNKEYKRELSTNDGKTLIILLDLSSSMNGVLDRKKTKLDILWEVFREKLSINLSGWKYGILGFGDLRNWIISPTTDTRCISNIKKPVASGSTPMLNALEISWAWVSSHNTKARFILISDGCPTDGNRESIHKRCKNYNNIPIDTIGIGLKNFNGFGYDETLLREISEITGGMFYNAYNVDSIINSVIKLAPANRLLLG